jgi:hypothetical protein
LNTRYLALAALLAPILPAQAQTSMEAFNPFAMLAPIMTPLGAMLVPMMAPMNAPTNPFNPTAMYNPATMANPMAMMPNIPTMPVMPGYGAPAGMVPFSGIQASPQAYGMPSQMPNPFVGNALMPYAMPAAPTYPAFPAFPGFPFPFQPSR